ncbi:hypothetical protein Trydic_g1306 [Trypoxylus dichotomus]
MTALDISFVTIISFCITCSFAKGDELIVETQNGPVLGRKILDSVYGWNGIPYAQPPLGNLRFEPPRTPNNWTGIWNATYDRSQCILYKTEDLISTFMKPLGNEDCLYLNVYTPKPPQDIRTPLPVMVWIHGGTFLRGNSSFTLYGTVGLVREDVIVVSFNYRLGIFGFISTGDDAAPGNNGLRDQMFALKWVQKNIKAFGGDPKQVTIFGESAGSASVSYLVLSPLTRGLFKQAIMESGTALCRWALSKSASDATFAVGTTLGIDTSSSVDLIDALKEISTERIHRASIAIMGAILAMNPLNGLVYAPVIEHVHDDAVVTASSYKKLLRGDFNRVTQIIGYNSAEFHLFKGLVQLLGWYLRRYDLKPSRLVPTNIGTNESRETIGKEIRSYYTTKEGTLKYSDRDMLNYLSDDQFVRPIQETARLTSQYATTYFYKFSYVRTPGEVGASHADELNYIFDSDYNTSSDRFVKRCVTKLWTNFAKYGSPTPNNGERSCHNIIWKPATPNDKNELYYINIDRMVSSGTNPDPRVVWHPSQPNAAPVVATFCGTPSPLPESSLIACSALKALWLSDMISIASESCV